MWILKGHWSLLLLNIVEYSHKDIEGMSNIDAADSDGLPATYSSHTRYNMASLGGRRPNPPEINMTNLWPIHLR